MKIIFSTAWYQFKAKFDKDTYKEWISNMLENVKNYKLVVYTNEESKEYIIPFAKNENIMIIIKPEEEFYGYRYKKEWEENHEMNYLLNQKTDWRVNMLWNEKIHFVNETIKRGYFLDQDQDADNNDNDNLPPIYGWCDIGYFRCRPQDISRAEIQNWPNLETTYEKINRKKIYYARVNDDPQYIKQLFIMANTKSAAGMPMFDIPPTQNSIAGGFFLITKENMEWFREVYDKTLRRYFFFKTLVKDDQIILVDVIFGNLSRFQLIQTEENEVDKWFQFQRYLL